MTRMWTRALLLGAMGLVGGSIVGCAQERAPINQVQADALAKSFFVGADLQDISDNPEFYMRGTVIDVGYGAAQDGLFTSTYAQPVMRIRWQITEDMLIARLAYERVQGSDGKGTQLYHGAPKAVEDGQVVGSYKISSHFDIRRSYNPTTGEEMNVVVENSTDRVWDQREYFRVDWSQNLATDAYDFDTMSMLGWIGGVEYEPMAYTVLDPADPDAPHFDAEQGYFDVTTKAFAKPAMIDLSALGWGIDMIPACLLPGEFVGGTNPYGNCNPVELTLRYSFRKVVDKDYEPLAYDGMRFQAFGCFTTDRVGYDRDYGMTDTQWFRFASRYNLWHRSHHYADPEGMTGALTCATKETTEVPTSDPNADPNRDYDRNGTADECEDAGMGARCDIFKKKCTVPYTERETVTTTWYVNGANTAAIALLQDQIDNTTDDAKKATLQKQIDDQVKKAEELFEATNWGVQEWDTALKTAVQASRLVECRKIAGGDSQAGSACAQDKDCREQCIQTLGSGCRGKTCAKDSDCTIGDTGGTCNNGSCQNPVMEKYAAYLPGAACSAHPDCVPCAAGTASCFSKECTEDSDCTIGGTGGTCDGGTCKNSMIDKFGAFAACEPTYPMWIGQQEDNDEAMMMARQLDFCRRKAVTGSTDEARKAGWESQVCTGELVAAANALAKVRGNGSDASAAAMAKLLPTQPMLVLCHNPVIGSDHPACGPVGLSPRLGDLRYNTVLHIDMPQSPSAWGIMVDADDPLTGEKVAASVNIWTHITDVAVIGLIDLVRYINGELKTSDITEGTYIDNWVKASMLSGGGAAPTMSKAQINQRLASSMGMSTSKFETAAAKPLPADIKKAMTAFRQREVMDVRASHEVASSVAYQANARMSLARNTPTEAALINQPMLQLAGIKGVAAGTSLTGMALDQASPLALNNPRIASQLRQMRENAMAARGACIISEAPETSALTGIADALRRKFPPSANESASDKQARYDKMFSYARRRYHYAVLAHEMGHSVGLRHNFVSSYAGLHFRPQYWQLRTANGTQNKECTDAVADGSTCIGPRYFDPMTSDEQDQMIWMYMQSSAMDYPGDLSQDMLGIGAWDFAAARAFYGDTVSVYNVKDSQGKLDNHYLSSGTLGQGLLASTDNFGGLVGIKYQIGVGNNAVDIHYSQLQKNFKVIQDCVPFTPAPPAWWNEQLDGIWDASLDGRAIKVDGEYTKCRSLPVDYMGWEQLRMPTVAEVGDYYRGWNAVDPGTKRVRVPYSFATDHWADLGNVSVYRHDNGADPYEVAMFLITTQEDRHIIDNYRRGRNTFNVRAAADRSYSRYNEKLLGLGSAIGFLGNIYKNFGAAQGYSWDTLWPNIIDSAYRENMIAATIVFDHYTRQLSRPEIGQHYQLSSAWGDPTLRAVNDADGNPGPISLVVPNGTTGYLRDIGFGGHLLENQLTTINGDWDTEYTVDAGSYYDKINTAILFSLSEDRFVSQSRQDFYDARFRSVGMADVLADGYRRVLANALTNDRSLLASWVTANNGYPETKGKSDPFDPQNKDALKYPKNPIGWTSWWPSEGPTPCFSQNGSNVCSGFTDEFLGKPGFQGAPEGTMVPIDPQVGWESQKFLIAWTLAYAPGNEGAGVHTDWVDMMRLYRIGSNADPMFTQRIEWQDPVSGDFYYAKTYGKECLFGKKTTDKAECLASSPFAKWVQKGIAARVLEYANELTSKGYLLDTATYSAQGDYPAGFNDKGRAVVMYQPDGTPIVVNDPAMSDILTTGYLTPSGPTCDLNVDPKCRPLSASANHWAVALDKYRALPQYLWEVVIRYGLGTPGQLGLYP